MGALTDDVAPGLRAVNLGLRPYRPVWEAMRRFTDTRDEDTADELWFLEHEPVFTLGLAGKREHILAESAIPVVPVDRGGQVTYHGPGQLVVYPLLDLRRLRMGARDLVCKLEQAVINMLARWHIRGERKSGAPGVYVQGAKIMALGLKIRKGCSFHGLAFNIDMDLGPYSFINPCGFKALPITQLADLGGPRDLPTIMDAMMAALCGQFGFSVSPVVACVDWNERTNGQERNPDSPD